MAKTPTEIKSTLSEVQILARRHSARAIEVLISIMNDISANQGVRTLAATELLNRGYGRVPGAEKFILATPEFYVYSIHDNNNGSLLYIGKGRGQRCYKSAERIGGRSRVRASFDTERDALVFERRLIRRFNPPHNVVHNQRRAVSNG